MPFPILKHLRPVSRLPRGNDPVGRDADELIQLWGAAAFDRASDLSWREDSGLTPSPRPGHWWSVRREIGRRTGQKDAEFVSDIAA